MSDMSMVLQSQETEAWTILPEYFLNQASLILDNSCLQPTFTDTFNLHGNTDAKYYTVIPWKLFFSTSGLCEAWTENVSPLLYESKDVELLMLDTSCLISARRTVESFSANLQVGVENVFYNVEDDPDHDPGFIISILVLIPESNRGVEHGIYSSLGRLMRDNSELLIDMHIIKRRGRQTRQLIPPEYQKVQ